MVPPNLFVVGRVQSPIIHGEASWNPVVAQEHLEVAFDTSPGWEITAVSLSPDREREGKGLTAFADYRDSAWFTMLLWADQLPEVIDWTADGHFSNADFAGLGSVNLPEPEEVAVPIGGGATDLYRQENEGVTTDDEDFSVLEMASTEHAVVYEFKLGAVA